MVMGEQPYGAGEQMRREGREPGGGGSGAFPGPPGGSVGERLRSLRESRGYSLRQLAERSRLSAGYLSEVENGHKIPSLRTLRRLAAALEADIGRIMPDPETGAPWPAPAPGARLGTVPGAAPAPAAPSGSAVPLGERLRLIREHRGLSLEQAARAAGVSAPFLSRVETGKASPGPAVLRRLAQALQVSIPVLLRRDLSGLGSKIRTLRQSLGLSREELGRRAGLSSGFLARLEADQSQASLETLERLAAVLGVSTCYLVLEDPGLEQMLAAMSPEVRQLLLDPNVQAVLRQICDMDEAQVRLVLQFTRLLKESGLRGR